MEFDDIPPLGPPGLLEAVRTVISQREREALKTVSKEALALALVEQMNKVRRLEGNLEAFRHALGQTLGELTKNQNSVEENGGVRLQNEVRKRIDHYLYTHRITPETHRDLHQWVTDGCRSPKEVARKTNTLTSMTD